jgi:Lon protease-like protein
MIELQSTATAGIDKSDLECPLCMRLFHDPIAINCGHTFCKNCLRRALALSPACPLCRYSCFLDISTATRNFTIEAIIRSLYPNEFTQRREEHVKEEEEINSQRLSFFFLSNTLHRLLPGMPVELYVFEPRYLQLMQRCMDDSCLFGISPGPEERLGSAVRLDRVRRLPNGNMHISGTVRFRFQSLSALEIEPGTLSLYSAQVRYIEDEDIGNHSNLALDLASLQEHAPEVMNLSKRSRRALLVNQGILGTQTELKACSLLRDKLTSILTRIFASLSPHVLERLHARYGQLPSGGGPTSRFSFFACAVLYLSQEERLICFQTTNTLRRLIICYAALERHQREYKQSLTVSSTSTVPSSIQASELLMVSEDVDSDEVGLRPLPELNPEIVLDMLNDQNTSRSGFIAMMFTILERSPALSSLLVLIASIVLILVLRN